MEHQSPESLPPITTKTYGVGNEHGRLAIEVQGQAGRIQFDRQLRPKIIESRNVDSPQEFWSSVQLASEELSKEDLAFANSLFAQITGEISEKGTIPNESTATTLSHDQPVGVRTLGDTTQITPGVERSIVEFQANAEESLKEAARRSMVEMIVRGGVARQQEIVSAATKTVVNDLMQNIEI